MFSKIDKRILSGLVVIVVLVLLGGFAGYKYLLKSNESPNTTNQEQTIQTENENTSESTQPINGTGIEVEAYGKTGGGALYACEDKCGDGICQKDQGTICDEAQEYCPEDCK